jgi:dethiobiotin synthetase
MAIGIFVTGTDTGVGKTLCAAALLHALARHHRRVAGMKPVTAGTLATPTGPVSEDATALRAASTVAMPPEIDSPVLLPEPLSPHLAAARAGISVDIEPIVACYVEMARRCDAVVVEGAGGFLVPLGDTTTGAELALALGLPVVLVVGMRLGCLNHALLSAEAIRAHGLELAGWIANRIDPAMLATDDNIAYLQRRLDAPLLADVAHGAASAPSTITIELPATWK